MSQNTNVQAQLNEAYIADCSTINILLDQRRKLKFFNVPPPRFTPISPYPKFTRQQLDMRRKVEILKYNNIQQNSKTNNLTKKETYALLARGNSNQLSQFTVLSLQNQDLSGCQVDKTKPTWTTACGVPGKPMLLEYDPNVPLYNYVNDATQNSNFATAPDPDTSIVKLYTLNQLQYLYERMYIFDSDPINQNIISGKNYQTRTLPVGYIVNTKFLKPQLLTYNLSIPVGIWMIGSKDHGVIDPSCDIPSKEYPHTDPSYGYLAYVNSCYNKFPGTFVDNTTITPTYPKLQFTIDYLYNKPAVSLQYSNQAVTPIKNPTYNSTLNSQFPVFFDVSFVPYYANSQFYGIQYVGNLIVNGLVLDVQPEEVYDLNLTMSYSYDYPIAQQFDMFQTGLFFNVEKANINVADGVNYTSSPPSYIDFSFNVVTTNNIPVDFNFFDYGTDIPLTSPVITQAKIAKVGPTYVNIEEIAGNYTYYDITRVYIDPSGNTTYTYTTNQNTSIYKDGDLIPNSKYIFKITPILNHMTGSTTTLGIIQTQNISINASIGQVEFYKITIKDILGIFSYYSVYRFEDTSGNNPLYVNYLQNSTFVDTNLNPGKNYYYTITPYLVSETEKIYKGTMISLSARTLYTIINTALIGPITSNSVTIVNITGIFDRLTMIRNGVTPGSSSNVKLDNLLNPPPNNYITDTDTRLVSGYQYDYLLVPSIYNQDLGKYIDGPSFYVGRVTIP